MRRILISSIIITCNTLVGIGQSLSELQDLAVTNNPGLKAKYKMYESAMTLTAERSGIPDPTIGFGYFVSPVETRVGPQQANLSITQTLPWFGTQKTEEKSGTAVAQTVLEGYNHEVSLLRYQVANVYFDIYALHKQIQIATENLAILESRKELTRNKLESGSGGLLEVLEVDMEVEVLKNHLAGLQDILEPMLVELQTLTYSSLDSINIPDSLSKDYPEFDMEVILSEVSQSNLKLKLMDARIAALNYELMSAEKKSTPSVTLGLNYTLIGERTDYVGEDNGRDAFLPTIGVKVPLWRKKHDARTENKSLEIEAESLNREELLSQLESQLFDTVTKFDDAERKMAMNQRLIEIGGQALEILITRYSSAEADFNSLLEMDRRILGYKLAYFEAEADRNNQLAFLNYLRGL